MNDRYMSKTEVFIFLVGVLGLLFILLKLIPHYADIEKYLGM